MGERLPASVDHDHARCHAERDELQAVVEAVRALADEWDDGNPNAGAWHAYRLRALLPAAETTPTQPDEEADRG